MDSSDSDQKEEGTKKKLKYDDSSEEDDSVDDDMLNIFTKKNQNSHALIFRELFTKRQIDIVIFQKLCVFRWYGG